MIFFRPIKRRPKIYNTKYCSQAANVHATCALIDSTKRTDKFKRLSAVINDESEENDKKLVIATNKINYKLWTNTAKETKITSKGRRYLQSCLTRAARNTPKESGDGELKLEDYNLAMEMHKKTKRRIEKRLKQSELMRRNLTENWLRGSKINEKKAMMTERMRGQTEKIAK